MLHRRNQLVDGGLAQVVADEPGLAVLAAGLHVDDAGPAERLLYHLIGKRCLAEAIAVDPEEDVVGAAGRMVERDDLSEPAVHVLPEPDVTGSWTLAGEHLRWCVAAELPGDHILCNLQELGEEWQLREAHGRRAPRLDLALEARHRLVVIRLDVRTDVVRGVLLPKRLKAA